MYTHICLKFTQFLKINAGNSLSEAPRTELSAKYCFRIFPSICTSRCHLSFGCPVKLSIRLKLIICVL